MCLSPDDTKYLLNIDFAYPTLSCVPSPPPPNIRSIRTGMLVMLLQSLMGASDEDIIEDYYRSNASAAATTNNNLAAAAVAATADGSRTTPVKGRLDRAIFSGTSREAMVDTLAFVRQKYGTVVPGYMDAIGFDQSWRDRLVAELRRGADSGSGDDLIIGDGTADRQRQQAPPLQSPSETTGPASPPVSRL